MIARRLGHCLFGVRELEISLGFRNSGIELTGFGALTNTNDLSEKITRSAATAIAAHGGHLNLGRDVHILNRRNALEKASSLFASRKFAGIIFGMAGSGESLTTVSGRFFFRVNVQVEPMVSSFRPFPWLVLLEVPWVEYGGGRDFSRLSECLYEKRRKANFRLLFFKSR